MKNIFLLLTALLVSFYTATAQGVIHVLLKETIPFNSDKAITEQFTILKELQNQFDFELSPAITWSNATYKRLSAAAIENTGSDASVRRLKSIYEFRLQSGTSAPDLIEQLQASNLFEYVEQEQLLPQPPGDIPPTTPSYAYLQAYHRVDSGVNMEYAWSKGIFGQNITVFDVEYGVNTAHEKLVDQPITIHDSMTISSSLSVDFTEHGTAAIGVVCADQFDYGNIGMMHGIASMTLVPESTEESGYNRVKAVTNAIAKANTGDIIMYEMQAGVGNSTEYGPAEINNTIWNLTKGAVDAGIIIIAAAGNGNVDLDTDSRLSSYRSKGDNGSIIVGAGSSDGLRNKLSFSTYGSRVNVQAWGQNVISAGYGSYSQVGGDFNQSYNMFSGTSSATPIVASCAIAIQSYFYSLTGGHLNCQQIRTILTTTGKPQGDPQSGNIGPLPNIKAAFDYVDSLVTTIGITSPDQSNSFLLYPNPTTSMIYLDRDIAHQSQYTYLFDINGRLVYMSNQPQQQLDVHHLESGEYIIVVYTRGNRVYKSKFVKY